MAESEDSLARIPSRGRHELAALMVLCFAGVLVAVVAAEIILRVTAYHRQFAQADATIGYVLTPDFARTVPVPEHHGGVVVCHTNNLGLRRDAPTALTAPPHTLRVLVLGDSQTEGIVDNDESYAAQLERTLNTHAEPRVEILNAAVSGYSPLLEYLWWQQRGRALHPDLVVLALYVGNDVAELLMKYEDFGGFGPRMKLPFLEATDGSWQIVLPGADGGMLGRLDWLLETHLRVHALAHRVFRRPAPVDGSSLAQVAGLCPGCLQTVWQASVAHGDPAGLSEGFERLDEVLARFQADVTPLHIPVIVFVVPTKLQVEPAAAANIEKAAAILGLHYDAVAFDDAVGARMIALAQRHGFATIDLSAALRAVAARSERPLYWALDWHLNTAGHQAIAQTVATPLTATLHTLKSR